MRVLLQLILPVLLQAKSVVKERNDVIKQALIPTLVNIIRHARMQEHGTDIDNLLDYMDEEKILDPFLQWLGWVTDMVLESEEEGEDQEQKDGESGEITESDENSLELEVLEKEESMEETMKKMEEAEDHEAIPQEEEEKASQTGQETKREIYDNEGSEESGETEENYYDEASKTGEVIKEEVYSDEASETGWPGDPKGYNGPKIPKQDGDMEDDVPQSWA